ncbi:MAG: hypothetical protein PHO26_02540 [Dehalococcoidia bacterium]|jgi:hypothetical protein|nr:hypothetical protein [Dehalococcoidia bacterium]MDD5495189.1 hypothetical protein [Dehalococcoidia bacterium]
MEDTASNRSRVKYRPEGWANPYSDDARGEEEKSIFEAGADAMLDMLLKEAHEYSKTVHHYMRHDDYLCDVLAHELKLR